MRYIVKARKGKTTYYGKRTYKTLAGAKKSIKSPIGKAYIKKWKLKGVMPVKQRKRKKMKL